MQRQRFVFVMIFVSVLFSCSTERKEHSVEMSQRLEFNILDNEYISSRVQHIDFVPLELTESSMFHDIDKIIFRNGLIYIGDFLMNKVVVYDMYGKLVFVVDRRGAGPGEYQELKSFTVDDENIYILDNFRHGVYVYDCHTGDYKETRRLPVVASDVEALYNGDFLLTFVPTSHARLKHAQPQYRVFVVGEDFSIKNGLFEYSDDEKEPVGKRTYFTTCGDSIVFSSFYFDGYTIFSRSDGSYRHIAIDFKDKVPEDCRYGEIELIREAGYQYISQVPVLCGGYVSVWVSSAGSMMSYFYDPNVQRFITHTRSSAENFVLPPIGSYDGRYVSLLSSYDQYQNLVERGFARAGEEVEHHLETEGYVLLFYTMK